MSINVSLLVGLMLGGKKEPTNLKIFAMISGLHSIYYLGGWRSWIEFLEDNAIKKGNRENYELLLFSRNSNVPYLIILMLLSS